MLTDRWAGRVARRNALMKQLLRERGIKRYGVFDVTTEGRELPGGGESSSGFVVDESGRVFSFWLDLDEKTHRVTFTDWAVVEPQGDWEGDEEYQQARAAAGLA